MFADNRTISLYDFIDYEVCVPGHLDDSWGEPALNSRVSLKSLIDGKPVSVIEIRADQAALLGFLRRLYSLGIPLVSVRIPGIDLQDGEINEKRIIE